MGCTGKLLSGFRIILLKLLGEAGSKRKKKGGESWSPGRHMQMIPRPWRSTSENEFQEEGKKVNPDRDKLVCLQSDTVQPSKRAKLFYFRI